MADAIELAHRLSENAEQLGFVVVAMASDEVLQVVRHEDDPDHVLQGLAFGVAFKLFLADQLDHVRNVWLGITTVLHDAPDERGMVVATGGTPGVIALAPQRIVTPRDLPAADVLRAGGEAETFGCGGIQMREASDHVVGIDQLAGATRATAVNLHAWIGCVEAVDGGDRGIVAWFGTWCGHGGRPVDGYLTFDPIGIAFR